LLYFNNQIITNDSPTLSFYGYFGRRSGKTKAMPRQHSENGKLAPLC